MTASRPKRKHRLPMAPCRIPTGPFPSETSRRIERQSARGSPGGLIVAVRALHALVALLRLDGKGRDRTGFEPTQADRLGRLLAITVSTVFDSFQRFVDLGDQLALAVAG